MADRFGAPLVAAQSPKGVVRQQRAAGGSLLAGPADPGGGRARVSVGSSAGNFLRVPNLGRGTLPLEAPSTTTPVRGKGRQTAADAIGLTAAEPRPSLHPLLGDLTSMRRSRAEPVSVEVREMELADLPQVFALGQKLFTAEQWPTLYRAWDEYEIVQLYRSDGEFCLVAAAGKRIVGFALGTVMEKHRSAWRYGWLLWLGVHPRFKRRHIATRLVNRLTELFIEHNVRMILVDTDEANHQALAFFRHQGFDNEIKHVYLSYNLDAHPKYLERKSEQWD
jgi:ribosomal protein S18 acetylase RimI-like enzyme